MGKFEWSCVQQYLSETRRASLSNGTLDCFYLSGFVPFRWINPELLLSQGCEPKKRWSEWSSLDLINGAKTPFGEIWDMGYGKLDILLGM